MKRLFIILAAVMMAVGVVAQETQDSAKVEVTTSELKPSISRSDSLLQEISNWIEHIELNMSLKNRFKLYKTENIYNLLRLDTKTGMIDQVQWSLERQKEGTMVINDTDLSYGYGYGSGSFELYPTNNMYQFILLDKTDGRMWHVQWGLNSKERWIRRIYF